MVNLEPSLRPIDLARLAGISTQQVRNYEAAGILPPAARTATGYRRFHAGHRRALLTFRALLNGYGRETAQEIMYAANAGDLPRMLALVDAGHAALHEQRRSLQATGEALEAVAGQAPETPTPRTSGIRIGELAAYLGVRSSTLRVWEAAGLLAPTRERGTAYRRFGPAEVRDAQLIHLLRQSRYRLPQIRPVLDDLRRTGSRAALRDAIAQRRAELTQRTAAMLKADSQLTDHAVMQRT